MSIAPTRPLTCDDLFSMRPSKRVDRWLFRGEIRESKVTKRKLSHSGITVNTSVLLSSWVKTRPEPRGKVFAGECYFRIRKNPETNVGIDVALASARQLARLTRRASFIDGPPILAVEILSPYDKNKDIADMIEEYLDCGVKVVWIIDPYAETVTVHRPNVEPIMYAKSQTLVGGPELPGFRCQVSAIFE